MNGEMRELLVRPRGDGSRRLGGGVRGHAVVDGDDVGDGGGCGPHERCATIAILVGAEALMKAWTRSDGCDDDR